MKLLTISFMMLTLSIQMAFADQKCKKPKIKIINKIHEEGQNRKIKILKLKYYDVEDAKYRTEGLSNRKVSYGKSTTYDKENLAYVGNEYISSWYVQYKFETGGKWSKPRWSKKIKTYKSGNCVKNKKYNLTLYKK